ncbi:transposase [Nocardia sp. R7R-8]|uniref:transposase n=1 Tax=Nocardia sp. R7R-8 TaxID=3459304 RepID=UPI00403DE575
MTSEPPVPAPQRSAYAALDRERIGIARLRRTLVSVPLPRVADGRLAVYITSWLRPEAHTCLQRILCHTYGRAKNTHQMIPRPACHTCMPGSILATDV